MPGPSLHALIARMDRTIVRNALSLLMVQVANFVLPLITFPYLLRVLGPAHFGALTFSFAVAAYFVLLTDYGFNLSASKRVAEHAGDKAAVSRIYWNATGAKALLALASYAVLLTLTFLVPKFAEERALILAASPIILASVLTPQWLFQGLERLSVISLCAIAGNALVVPLTFWLVRTTDDTWIAVLIRSLAPLFAGLATLALIRRDRLVSWAPPTLNGICTSLREGWHVFLSTAAISIYTSTNTIVLGFLAGNIQVGYFSAADRIRTAAQGLVAPLSGAVYPRVNALMKDSRDAGFAMIRKLFAFQCSLTLLGSCLLWLLAPFIVRWVMGVDFEAAVAVLRWMAFLPFIVSLSNVFGIHTMLTLGRTQAFSRILMASALLNVALLVPLGWLHGAQGAAVALLVTESAVSLAMGLYLWRQRIPLFRWMATPQTR